MSLMEKLFGDLNERELKKIYPIADSVMALEPEMEKLSDDELRGKTQEFKDRLADGETLDDLLPEAFAVCREAAWRSLGMKHFRVQVIGGIVLHQGRIAEMKTGEGKTLVATLPAYLNALEGKGVHIVTVNDYLAKRDAEWMGRLYSFLGLKVGCVIHSVNGPDRKAAYDADVTYGTNNEFGFDYLRDNMVTYKEDLIQRDLHYAIVDEVDSILIDEARTPLIISGKGVDSSSTYRSANSFVRTLDEGKDYEIEEKDKQISLTEDGVRECEKYFGIENFSDPDNMELNHYVMQALRANYIMKRDVDYIVKDGEILIVDEFTGRLMYGRRFSNGLHQAIEAKEGVEIRAESKTLATITLQNYFRMYGKLAGMTGTAKTEEDEFREIYNMDVVEIPTNKPVIRDDREDAVFAHETGKFKAIADKVAEAHATGQPVLVGTISIEISEHISKMLKKRGIPHNVLNAKQHEKEAEIIAQAGRKGAVTIATNMAGRGTDIILGGNPDFEARKEMERAGYTADQIGFAVGFEKSDDPELLEAREKYSQILSRKKDAMKGEQQEVIDLGGLCIVGTERHESRRIDNQLRGRSGRQGDPGDTQFFISLEDDLMRLFGGDRIQKYMDRFGLEDDEALEAGLLSRTIENAQKKVEGKNFGIRKYVLQYDNVMNKQREIIYSQRRMVLDGEDLKGYIMGMMEELVDSIIDPVTMESRYPEEWDFDAMSVDLCKIKPLFKEALVYTDEEKLDLTPESLKEDVKETFRKIYDDKEAEIGAEHMREAERMILLRVVDNRWMDHIDAMDQLKNGIGLRALGQQDPTAAYASEGFAMFDEMVADIREETVKYCYSMTLQTKTERRNAVTISITRKDEYEDEEMEQAAQERRAMARMAKNGGGMPQEAPKEDKKENHTPIRRDHPKIGRNDPCPCGSGKKYKNCHGRFEN
ncbi:MAG: preprotein translocase subunit SecA [Mobilibacterium timonense]|uniref:preprotein translocase subunit SecA n=1 Tax=Mobilibacterium timonense TaxID=1871012 RepID=UPI0023577A0B|nr:preprotein translocase subunit SecA [Mobilibacterium timonense]MBM6989827.1 preprotein translocase subunit SecA [Mobilibacterium timonense]